MSDIRGLVQEAYVSCVSGFPLQSLYRFELPRLSDMNNCLSCGRHHVDNLIEGLCWNCYNYLFANFCLISLDDNFS
jgi:hypothetical protein